MSLLSIMIVISLFINFNLRFCRVIRTIQVGLITYLANFWEFQYPRFIVVHAYSIDITYADSTHTIYMILVYHIKCTVAELKF